MMFCPSCGKEFPDQAVYCPSCGIRLPERKKQKKKKVGLIIAAVLLAAVILCCAVFLVFLSGGYSTRIKNRVLSPYSGVKFENPSEREEILSAYGDLLDEAVLCCKTDNINFIALLYRDYHDHVAQISNEVPSFYYYAQNEFPKTDYDVICKDDTYVYVCALNWQIDGTYPDESVQYQTINHILSKDSDGTWKFDASQEASSAIIALGEDMVPSGYLDAAQENRNTAIFNAYKDYTWVTMQVIPGAASGTCYFIWQDAQGDIHCFLNIKNGTDVTQEISSVTINAQDSSLGRVFSYNSTYFDGTRIPAGIAKNIEVVIPLNEISTKQDPWYTLTAQVSVVFR